MGRLFLPIFDGSFKSSTKAWVEKLDVYFQLNQQTKGEAIKIAMLHLEGETHGWLFHRLTTMGHTGVTAYEDFTKRVLERFERRPGGAFWGVDKAQADREC